MVNVVDSRLKISFPRDSAAIDCFLFVSLASFPMSVRRMLTSSVDKKCAVEGISQEPISYSQGIVLIYILSKSYGGISDEDRHMANVISRAAPSTYSRAMRATHLKDACHSALLSPTSRIVSWIISFPAFGPFVASIGDSSGTDADYQESMG
jgi:hypothetical protein